MDNKKKKVGKTQEEILAEIAKLTEQSNENASSATDLFLQEQLGDEELETGYDISSLINSTADPEKSHKIYYTVRRVLMQNLPNDKKIREYIYEQKNIFLTMGKHKKASGTRDGDSRMAYIPHFLETALRLVMDWVIEGSNPADIYNKFYDLNKERGYLDDASNSDTKETK